MQSLAALPPPKKPDPPQVPNDHPQATNPWCLKYPETPETGEELEAETYTCDESRGRRRRQKQDKKMELQEFLRKHNFRAVNKPRTSMWSCLRSDLRPIHVAAQLGEAQIVRLLLKADADPSSRTSQGQCALTIASQRGHQLARKTQYVNAPVSRWVAFFVEGLRQCVIRPEILEKHNVRTHQSLTGPFFLWKGCAKAWLTLKL